MSLSSEEFIALCVEYLDARYRMGIHIHGRSGGSGDDALPDDNPSLQSPLATSELRFDVLVEGHHRATGVPSLGHVGLPSIQESHPRLLPAGSPAPSVPDSRGAAAASGAS